MIYFNETEISDMLFNRPIKSSLSRKFTPLLESVINKESVFFESEDPQIKDKLIEKAQNYLSKNSKKMYLRYYNQKLNKIKNEQQTK